MRAATIGVLLALVLAACGSDRYASERGTVEELMPDAEDVTCSGEPRRAVDCEGELDGRRMFCEFRVDEAEGRNPAYSGTSSCWTDP